MSLAIIATGSARKDITAAGTYNLKAQPGKVGQVVVWNAGTGATVDIYDDPSGGTTNHCWSWVSADGKSTYGLQYPMTNGIVVVVVGTPSLSVVYA